MSSGMRPAFSHTSDAILFLLVLCAALAAPWVLPATGLVSRSDAYRSVPAKYGPYHQHHSRELESDDPIDILFVGFSVLWTAIDVEQVRVALSRELGREARVLVLGANWRGEDAAYTVIQDLLRRRTVGMVVLSVPTGRREKAHPVSHLLWAPGALSDPETPLPLLYRVALYAESVVGAPRHVLTALRRNHLPRPRKTVRGDQGAWLRDVGYAAAHKSKERSPFVPLAYPQPTYAPREITYWGRALDGFVATGASYKPFETAFTEQTAQLVRQHGAYFALLHIPSIDDRGQPVFVRQQPAGLGIPAPLVAVPPKRFFFGVQIEQAKHLYQNATHFNSNGARYFTSAITPALVSLFVNRP